MGEGEALPPKSPRSGRALRRDSARSSSAARQGSIYPARGTAESMGTDQPQPPALPLPVGLLGLPVPMPTHSLPHALKAQRPTHDKSALSQYFFLPLLTRSVLSPEPRATSSGGYNEHIGPSHSSGSGSDHLNLQTPRPLPQRASLEYPGSCQKPSA